MKEFGSGGFPQGLVAGQPIKWKKKRLDDPGWIQPNPTQPRTDQSFQKIHWTRNQIQDKFFCWILLIQKSIHIKKVGDFSECLVWVGNP